MSLVQIKGEINKYSKTELQSLVVELYKIIPKFKKEEYDIDNAIKRFREEKYKISKKTTLKLTLFDLEPIILDFVDYSKQNQLKNNLLFSRSDKAQWVKKIKQWYNELVVFIEDKDKRKVSLELLEKLYHLLCFACGCEIFKQYNSFDTLSLSQTEYFEKIIHFGITVYDKDFFVKNSISLILENDVDNETSKTTLMRKFAKYIRNTELANIAINNLKGRIVENGYKKEMKTDKSLNSDKLFYIQEKHNDLVIFTFICYLSISEYNEAVKFLRTKYCDTVERKFYIMIRTLFECKEQNLIIHEIDVMREKRTVKIRDQILELERHIRKHDELPLLF